MSAALDFTKARETMVEQQVRPWDVLDPRVLEALVSLPREDFVCEAHRDLAYTDMELPLAHGERMFKPVLDGRTLQALALDPGDEVLEIGTGSGFTAACMGRLARDVVSIERHPDLAEAATARILAQGIGNVRVEPADAFAWDSERRFDAICIGAAVGAIPDRFMQWLKPQGRLFAVRGRRPAMEAVLLHNQVNAPRIESLFETDLAYLAGAAPVPVFQF